MEEVWKDIPNYEKLYKVSNLGRVKSLSKFHKTNKMYSSIGYYSKEKILKSIKDKRGYNTVVLCKNSKPKTYRIHRLVAQAFIPNPENKPQVNHKDGNKLNNNVENLEWCTCQDNIKHAWKTGLNYNTEHQYIMGKSSAKKIIQYSKNSEYIKEWESITKASVQLNISIQNISACCRGKGKTAGGFIWKYKN